MRTPKLQPANVREPATVAARLATCCNLENYAGWVTVDDDMTDAEKVAAWDRLTELVAAAERMLAQDHALYPAVERLPGRQSKRKSKRPDPIG